MSDQASPHSPTFASFSSSATTTTTTTTTAAASSAFRTPSRRTSSSSGSGSSRRSSSTSSTQPRTATRCKARRVPVQSRYLQTATRSSSSSSRSRSSGGAGAASSRASRAPSAAAAAAEVISSDADAGKAKVKAKAVPTPRASPGAASTRSLLRSSSASSSASASSARPTPRRTSSFTSSTFSAKPTPRRSSNPLSSSAKPTPRRSSNPPSSSAKPAPRRSSNPLSSSAKTAPRRSSNPPSSTPGQSSSTSASSSTRVVRAKAGAESAATAGEAAEQGVGESRSELNRQIKLYASVLLQQAFALASIRRNVQTSATQFSDWAVKVGAMTHAKNNAALNSMMSRRNQHHLAAVDKVLHTQKPALDNLAELRESVPAKHSRLASALGAAVMQLPTSAVAWDDQQLCTALKRADALLNRCQTTLAARSSQVDRLRSSFAALASNLSDQVQELKQALALLYTATAAENHERSLRVQIMQS